MPLVLGPDGERLAKRHGSVTLSDQLALGRSAAEVLSWFGASLDLCEPGEPVTPSVLLARFDPARSLAEPWVLPAASSWRPVALSRHRRLPASGGGTARRCPGATASGVPARGRDGQRPKVGTRS